MYAQEPIVRFTLIEDFLEEFHKEKSAGCIRRAVVARGESLVIVVTALVNGTLFRFDHDCGSSELAESKAAQMHHRIDTLCDLLRIEIRRGIWEHPAPTEAAPE